MALRPWSWKPVVTAFGIWFTHFMACWAASEIWPHQWAANRLAWVVTAMALAALALHFVRIGAAQARGALPDWCYRFAQGAVAIATTAVLFSLVPSMVFLP